MASLLWRYSTFAVERSNKQLTKLLTLKTKKQ